MPCMKLRATERPENPRVAMLIPVTTPEGLEWLSGARVFGGTMKDGANQYDYGMTTADEGSHLAFVGTLAASLENEIARTVNRKGGLSPQELQGYVGRYLDALMPMSSRDRTQAW